MENKNLMKKIFNDAGYKLSDEKIDLFFDYYEMIIETNKYMNLTSITDFYDFIIKHFVDSISISKFFDIGGIKNIIDVGTGAGFPGIPLKIFFPQLKVVLVDSLNKRVSFLNKVIDKLNLKEAEALHFRAEELACKIEYRESFDLAVSRAVANLSTLAEYCIPFVKLGGYFVPYKAKQIEKEIDEANNAITILGGKICSVEKLLLDNDIERSLIFVEKISSTDNKYPRKSGIPKNNPL